MSNIDIVRAWKDEEYRNSLTSDQLAMLPENPAGMVELDEEALELSRGGDTELVWSIGCCGGVTHYNTCWGYTVCGAICSHLVCP
jgi:mersacidin/lichenicidin family type 2 lantibiotic